MLICYQPTAEMLFCPGGRLFTVEGEVVSSEDGIRLKCYM